MSRSIGGSVAAWISTPPVGNGPDGVARGTEPSPRALEARGFATLHHVLVQLADVGDRPRFAESCPAFGDVVWCDDLEDLVRRAEAREAMAVVVDVVDAQGTSTADVVAAMRRRRPDLPIVAWCERGAAIIPLARLAAAGISAVIFRDDLDFERRVFAALTRASDVAFQQLTDQTLYRRVPDRLIPVVRYCLDHPAGVPKSTVMARALGSTPRALIHQLQRAGLPSIAVLSSWSRALAAAYRLEHTTESTLSIARSLGFSTGTALSQLLRRLANEPASGLREPGGFGWVLRCFERHLVKCQRGR